MSPSATTASRPFLSSSIELGGIISSFMILGLSASWLGLFGRWHWALDLFSHFRWQYLVVCLVAMVWAARCKRRVVLAISASTLLLNAALIGQLAFAHGLGKASLAHDFHLRVLSLNVLTSNADHDRVLSYLRGADADIIMLMEVDATWEKALKPLEQSHPHHIVEARYDNFGIALYSRLPLEALQIMDLIDVEVPSIEAKLKLSGHELTIIGTHPLPPMGPTYSAQRDAQLISLAQRVRDSHTPTVVIGDLNSTPWSHGMSLVQAGGTLGYRSLQPAWTPTWYGNPLLAIPIDHVLCTAPLVVEKRTVGPNVGSDHRGLLVELRWVQP